MILSTMENSDEKTLDSLSSELLHVLKEEMGICKQMVDLLQKERESIKNLSTEELEAHTKQKTTLSLQLRILEESRISQVAGIAHIIKKDPGEVNLSLLCEIMPKQRADEFRQCQSSLKALSQSIEELNKQNASVIALSLKQLKEYYQVLTSFGTSFPTYQKNGEQGTLSKGKKIFHQRA